MQPNDTAFGTYCFNSQNATFREGYGPDLSQKRLMVCEDREWIEQEQAIR